MRAKYAGKCARTGASYPSGTNIVKGDMGWEVATDGIRVGAPGNPIVYRHARLPDGTLKQVPVNKGLFCSNCIEADGKDKAELSRNPQLAAPYAREKRGDDFVCLRCGSTIHILTDAETKEAFPPPPRMAPEKRRCWECGCEFTYADCKRNGGDWNENGGYCGC
jgi:hypothetical protein